MREASREELIQYLEESDRLIDEQDKVIARLQKALTRAEALNMDLENELKYLQEYISDNKDAFSDDK